MVAGRASGGLRDRSIDRGRPRYFRSTDPILLAAAELLWKTDFERVRMTDIADRAGFAKQTVYNRYGGKTEILAAIVDCVERVLADFLMEEAPSGAPAASGTGACDRSARLVLLDTAVPDAAAGGLALLADALRAMYDAQPHMVDVALVARRLPWIIERTHRSRTRLQKALRYSLVGLPDLADAALDSILLVVVAGLAAP